MDNNSASTEFKQLIAKGKEQGYLTIDEINDLISPDDDRLSVFIQTFIDIGINVCDTPPEADDILLNGAQTDTEDVEIVANQLDSSVDIGRTTDPVRMYMREMGNVSLLSKEQEKEIAKTNKKREKKGMPPISKEDDIYQEAGIEYIHDLGGYYLIKYERGDVRAWGAVKG